MRALGYQDVRILFLPMLGAVTAGQRNGATTWKHVVVLLAGPLPGLVLALALCAGGLRSALESSLAWSLLLINLFNLLPFAGLDGQQLLEEAVFRRQRHVALAFRVVTMVAMFAYGARHHDRLLALLPLVFVVPLIRSFQLAKVGDRLKSEGLVPPQDIAAVDDATLLTLLKRVGSFAAERLFIIATKGPDSERCLRSFEPPR